MIKADVPRCFRFSLEWAVAPSRHRIQANSLNRFIKALSHGHNHTAQFAATQQLQVVLASEKSLKFCFRTKSSSFISSS